MAPVVPFIPLITSGISLMGGLVTGTKAAKDNQNLIAGQNNQLSRVQQMAEQLASQVSRADYQSQANADVNANLKDVLNAMAERGMGRSTAALTAASGASAAIRSQYGKAYLSDRLSALQTAGSMVAGVASTPRMGYDSDPYAGMRSGIQGLGQWAGDYVANQNRGTTRTFERKW